MLTPQLIEDYLTSHPVVSKVADKQKDMLRKIFSSLGSGNDTNFFVETSELMAFCKQELTDAAKPDSAIAKIANKAMAILLARKQ